MFLSLALIIALVAVVALWRYDLAQRDAACRERERMLLDEFQSFVRRVSTEPRLEVAPYVEAVKVDPEVRNYISDLPYDDARWNEYRGVGADEDEPQP